MKYSIEISAIQVMKSGKRYLTDGIELPNQDKIRTLGENETYKYLYILEADTIKQVKKKEKLKKEYPWRTRKLLETNLSSRNIIKGINIWTESLFLKWTREELKQMDQRTRKLMTSQRRLWQTICIKKGGKKRTSQYWRQRWCINATVRGLHRKTRRSDYNHQEQDRLNDGKYWMIMNRRQKYEEKQLYGRLNDW